MPPDDLDRRLGEVRASTARLLDALDELGLDDDAVRAPSLLPGWTRAHVLTHLARNADAFTRALAGARRGQAVPMYPDGPDGREADIVAGSRRPAAELVDDVVVSAGRLDEAWSAMTPSAWDESMLTRTGVVPAWRSVPMRWRELEIHRIDLDVGYGPADWPATFVAPLLPSLVDPERLGPRLPAGTAVDLEATDTGRRWSAGDGPRRVTVRGPSWALTCWLVGRPAAVRDVLGDPPELAPWA